MQYFGGSLAFIRSYLGLLIPLKSHAGTFLLFFLCRGFLLLTDPLFHADTAPTLHHITELGVSGDHYLFLS